MKSIFSIFVLLSQLVLFGQDNDTAMVPDLSSEQIEVFRNQAIKSVSDLSNYINIVSDKKESSTRKDANINLAVKLFCSENNTVETSSINNSTINLTPIRKYLVKLKMLNYKQVFIKWYDIYLSSEFKKGPDGYYYGTATIYQKFEGIREMGSYKDITKKNIQLVLIPEKSYEGFTVITEWKLKLGDIKVDETKF